MARNKEYMSKQVNSWCQGNPTANTDDSTVAVEVQWQNMLSQNQMGPGTESPANESKEWAFSWYKD